MRFTPVPDLTAAKVRAMFPSPTPFDRAWVSARGGARLKPGCYCVGGAFLMALGEPGDAADGTPDEDVRFPTEFADTLAACNPRVRDFPDTACFHDWSAGNGDMSLVYEAAIQGASDYSTLVFFDETTTVVPNHTDLAWELLDDALTYDAAAHTPAREVRLLRGCLLGVSADPDYRERPELHDYYRRLGERYRTLTRD